MTRKSGVKDAIIIAVTELTEIATLASESLSTCLMLYQTVSSVSVPSRLSQTHASYLYSKKACIYICVGRHLQTQNQRGVIVGERLVIVATTCGGGDSRSNAVLNPHTDMIVSWCEYRLRIARGIELSMMV